MDYLPVELMPIILKFLPIKQINSLRRVNKKWKFIIDRDLKPKSLTVFHKTNRWIDFETIRKYFYPLSLVELREEPLCSALRSKKFERVQTLSSYLIIDEMCMEIGHFYNLFTELKKLKINNFSRSFDSDEIAIIELKKLKEIEIVYTDIKIVLNAPQLERLKAPNLVDIFLKFKENLKRLKLKNFKIPGTDLEDVRHVLPKLVNLEKLSLDQDIGGIITDDLLETKLTKLKELKITCSFMLRDEIQNLSNPYSEITYRRNGLNIYINGYLIDMYKNIIGDNHFYFDESELNELKFVSENYKTINKIRGKFIVNYQFLIDQFGSIPLDFHQKVRIDELKIKESAKDENDLLRFIEKSKASIIMFDSLFIASPTFYDRLIGIGNEIKFITLESKTMIHIPKRFKFIFQMKSLKQVSFKRYYMSLDFVARAIESIKFENFFRLNFYSFHGYDLDFCLTMGVCGASLYFNDMLQDAIKKNLKKYTDLTELELCHFKDECKKQPKYKRTESDDLIFLIGKIRLDILCKDFAIKECFRTFVISKEILGQFD